MNQEGDNLKLLVIIGIAVMLLLFASFLLAFLISQKKKIKYQQHLQALREGQQNQLIEAAVRSEETERHRIAETLHDEVGAILSSCKLHIQGIKPTHLDERDKELYNKGKELLDEGITKVRGISHNLHSNILKELGLNEAIRHFMNKVVQGTMINTNVELDDNYTTNNTENDISIYRMIQELINNIIKHSKATEIKVSSIYNGDALTFTLYHNGKGITQQEFEALRYNKEGLGLKNIQNRVILLKGEIHFNKDQDGYATTILIPVNVTYE
jgi:two-component system, NarL family, sensor kinase